MQYIPVVMTRDDLENIPAYDLPNGYGLRTFVEGDERTWAEIEVSAGEFADIESALTRFREEFGPHIHDLKERCFFVHDADGFPVGTAMAWYNSNFLGSTYGRLHWVGIRKEFQGKGLAKPLVGAAARCLAEHHDKAYLTSQTTSFKGIKIYLDFGFVPFVETEKDMEAWGLLADLLRHPALAEFSS